MGNYTFKSVKDLLLVFLGGFQSKQLALYDHQNLTTWLDPIGMRQNDLS